ncbi:MAG: S8 family serine peptidase, partial [Chloroflexota bacterium]
MSRKPLHVILFLLATTLLVAMAPPGAPGAAATGSHFVQIPAAAVSAATSLGLNPRLAADYGSFHWLELDDAGFSRLSASNVPFTYATDAGQVRVMGYHFDPLIEGEPALPAGLRADQSGPALRLVQLVGPTNDAWLEQLKAAGLTVLQYYPHHTFLVWGTAAQAEAAAGLEFVRWQGVFHPAYKINGDLAQYSGRITNVDVMFYNDGHLEATLKAIADLGGQVAQAFPSQPDKAFYDAIVQLDKAAVESVARLNTVLWLGYSSPEPGLEDEISDQIIAGNYTGGVPFPGYFTFLGDLGYDGAGVTWAIIDTGVDYQHPDLGSHIVGGYSFPTACNPPGEPGSDCPSQGHGTHVAGIVGGDATGGFTDPSGFYYGLGVAPGVGFFAMNSLSGSPWPPAGGWQEHSKQAVLGGAVGGNNSWTTGEGTNHGYQASERTHDIMVRDGNFDTASVAEPLIEVFSAGNSGPGSYTLTSPKEAKNLIIVASSQNYRLGGNIETISSFSSRGPAQDGRYVPTIATPGENVISAYNDTGSICGTPIPGTNNLYVYCSGTSMAAPHASGSIVLITEWWRTFNAGADPSPAMAKALLVNGARDMGTADRPNFNEGWGRVYLPDTVSPDANVIYRDQLDSFDNTGESWTLSVGVPDPTKPLKISVAWSDAPGAVGANPALVNNLNLTVVNGANTYLGNRFTAGWSSTGGTADVLNNIENVFIQSPAGSATITVDAANISGDGIPYTGDTTDQDFVLVCYNCALAADFTLSADPTSQDVCAPADATYDLTIGSILGYSDLVTLSASGNPAGTTADFSVNPVTPPGTSVLTIGNTGAAASGNYSVDVVGVAPTSTHTVTVGLNLYASAPDQLTLLTPADGATNQSVRPTFTWTAASQGGTYEIEIATDSGFSNIVDSASGLTDTTYTIGFDLDTNTTYYWRVRATNPCGDGEWSEVFSFTTEPAPGDCSPGYLPNVEFTDDFEAGGAGWTHSGTGDTWALSTQRPHSGAYAYKAVDSATVSDQRLVSPAVALPSGQGPLTLQFWNYQAIEDISGGGCYDGAILEISTDGGGNWTQLESELLTDPYDGAVSSSFGNPLGGLNAWCGDPQAYLNSIVDLDAYAGQTVNFRFRLGSDSSVSREGWYVDDVVVQSCVPEEPPIIAGVTTSGDVSGVGVYGSEIAYEVVITNTGNTTDTYSVSYGSSNWMVDGPTSVGPIAPGASETVHIHVTVGL